MPNFSEKLQKISGEVRTSQKFRPLTVGLFQVLVSLSIIKLGLNLNLKKMKSETFQRNRW